MNCTGYIKRVGYGPEPNKQTPNLVISKLQEKLKKTKHKLKYYMNVMTQAMVSYRMQVPVPQFSSNSTFLFTFTHSMSFFKNLFIIAFFIFLLINLFIFIKCLLQFQVCGVLHQLNHCHQKN